MPKFEEIYKGPSPEDLRKHLNEEALETMGYSFDSEGGVILDERGNPILDKKRRDFDPTIKDSNKGLLGRKTKMGREMIESFAEKENENEFEDIDIIGSIIKKIRSERESEFNKEMKERPDFSDQEKTFMEEFFKQWFRKTTSGEKVLTKEAELSAINEFKESFPEKYAQIINRRVLPDKIQWTKEMFRDSKGKIKEGLVSYYPNKENPAIKYVLKTTDGPIMPKSEKFFAASFISSKKGVVIFCEEAREREADGKKIIKKRAPEKKVLSRKVAV